ncbi:maleylpyruvate isomerase N-terminal domain-containing protein [Mycobacterium tilburgii]|uniref:maleylpyruvate isomerase N-terminal domain-containing protein n=1 Tax=Mycobacterium tilburgii TaxID=44467 RepID=UPI001182F034
MAPRAVTTLDKSEVLDGLFTIWDSIDALLAGLSESQWRAATPLPDWDVQAVVSHINWHRVVSSKRRAAQAGHRRQHTRPRAQRGGRDERVLGAPSHGATGPAAGHRTRRR